MRHPSGTAFRNDAYAKVTGRATYTDDLKASGMLHAVPVHTPFVRARGMAIDAVRAASIPGVVRIITAADIPGESRFGQIRRDCPILVADRVESEGDVAALVVAHSRETALEAAKAVSIRAEELPPVTDPEAALGADAPVIPPWRDDNLVNHGCVRRGDAEDALASSFLVVRGEFATQHIEHAYMEPEAALAIPRPDGTMEVHGSMQHPFSTRRFVAAALGEPFSDIEVFNTTMGGGFGGKDDTAAIVCARAAIAARLTGRPVKIRYDREWSVRESYKRHPYRMRYAFGFDREGRLTGAGIDMLADSGPYLSVTPWVNWRSTAQCCGPYVVPAVRMDIRAAATNNVFTGAMRGFGAPQVNFAVEQLMDMAAERLGIDPVEIRRRNIVRQGSTTITGQILDKHTVSLESVMDRVVAEIGYDRKKDLSSRGISDTDRLYGIGLAVSYRGASLGAEGMDYCAAIVNCQPDGSVLLETGIHENGQGAESAQMLILAGELGVSLSRIRYRRPSTSSIPDGGTTVATRGTLMGGGAIVAAVRELKRIVAQALEPELGCPAGEAEFRDDTIRSPAGVVVPWDEAMRILHRRCVYPYAFGSFRAPPVSWDERTGQGDAYFTYVYSCQAVELEVSKKTGAIRLTNIVAAHDIGKAVNPPLLRGQIYGGIAQAVGQALMEDLAIVNGRIGHLNFDSYRIPRARDMPEITAIIVENPDQASPTGAKGIGEPSTELLAGAIANAVCNATGKRRFSLPIRIEPEEFA